jgi:hypothetical protein
MVRRVVESWKSNGESVVKGVGGRCGGCFGEGGGKEGVEVSEEGGVKCGEQVVERVVWMVVER